MYHMANVDFRKQKVYIDKTIENVVAYHDDVSFQLNIIKHEHHDAFLSPRNFFDEDQEEQREIKSIEDANL